MNKPENHAPPNTYRSENPGAAESRSQVIAGDAVHQMADKRQKWDKVEPEVDESVRARDSSAKH